MTALHVPDDGCCCSEDLAAVAQAVVDVLVGFQALVCADMFDPTLPQAMEHQAKACTILQNVLTDYAENHGAPDPYHDSLAFAHVNERMRHQVTGSPPPIDWEAPYGLDWVGMSASLVYAPTFRRASLVIERKSIYRPQLIKKTGLWAELPDTPPRNARESLMAIYRILQDAEADYWIRYLRERK